MDVHMLTTIDNPFNPFTQFKEWYVYDTASGHHTLSFLGRVVLTSSELSEADQVLATEQAIDEIVQENVSGLYRKVAAPNDSSTESTETAETAETTDVLNEKK